LIEEREKQDLNDVAIVRLEQYHPFNAELLKEVCKPYEKAKRLVWCQEEPRNMGAWTFLMVPLELVFGKRPEYAGRAASASPATGFLARHNEEQAALVNNALKGE